MPSFSDSIFIFFLALLLFGPKKLPELARYLGKLMGEFRRASAEFRLQMDDEFRAIEQSEQQKKIAAIEAAAPVSRLNVAEPEHPHVPLPLEVAGSTSAPAAEPAAEPAPEPVAELGGLHTAPLPIASNGDLHLMPPSTGLPGARSSSLAALFDAIPRASEAAAVSAESEASTHA